MSPRRGCLDGDVIVPTEDGVGVGGVLVPDVGQDRSAVVVELWSTRRPASHVDETGDGVLGASGCDDLTTGYDEQRRSL